MALTKVSIVLTVNETAKIIITMDKNSVLEYRLAKAGTSIEITGEGPFKVILGNGLNAQLFYNDEQIDLSSTTNSVTNVSCLVLPTGRCSEFTLSN